MGTEKFVVSLSCEEGEKFRAVLDSYGVSWEKTKTDPAMYKVDSHDLLSSLVKVIELVGKIDKSLPDQEELKKDRETLEKNGKYLDKISRINQTWKTD